MPCYNCVHCGKCDIFKSKTSICCSACGAPLPPGVKDCPGCGASLLKTAQAKPASLGGMR